MAIAPMLTTVAEKQRKQHTRSQSDVISGVFDGMISNILRDRREESRHGRPKWKNRLPYRWKERYLDKEIRMHSSKDFRATFGVLVGVFTLVYSHSHAHKTHPDIFMMYMKIF